MLAVSPLKPTSKEGNMADITSFSFLDLPEFEAPEGFLVDDFDDFIQEGDVLPDLGVDFMPDFSVSDDSDDMGNQVVPSCYEKASITSSGRDECKNSVPQAATNCKDDKIDKSKKLSSPSSMAKKSNNTDKNTSQAKRKTKKVDWTPDLHRRFVQAVEQLGVDKAVPWRILELMGIHCLTRHNVASHLQKYRSHRKHLRAREAEATSWSHKRHMYAIAVAPTTASGAGKSKVIEHQRHPPTFGFPPMTQPPPIHHHHPFRPLHVWGHPTTRLLVEHQSAMPMWPSPPPPVNPSFWHSHHQHRFGAAPLLPGIPPSHAAMSKSSQSAHVTHQSARNRPPLMDLHPTKESIDAAIGDVLAKPWLPLPIGLKPPSMDSVMVELQRQGIPKIPPSSACS